MFNNSFRKEALEKFEEARERYELRAESVSSKSIELMRLRQDSSEVLIKEVEFYFAKLANAPKEFDKSFAEYKLNYLSFSTVIDKLKKEANTADIQAGSGAGASLAAGVGVAALAPTAAMAIATTFGAASTGTAISALSGAAATNAALAWLGGGALAAGGGGMVAGNTLLALSGPIGWAIGGVVLTGTGVYSYRKNKRIGEEAIAKRKEIEVLDSALKTALIEINDLIKSTETHVQGVKELLNKILQVRAQDYNEFSIDRKEQLNVLSNHVLSLSALLNKKINV